VGAVSSHSITIKDVSAAATAAAGASAGGEPDAATAADEDYARRLQAKMDAQAIGNAKYVSFLSCFQFMHAFLTSRRCRIAANVRHVSDRAGDLGLCTLQCSHSISALCYAAAVAVNWCLQQHANHPRWLCRLYHAH
jgi:hypothetical protein